MKRSLWLIPLLLCMVGMVSWAWAATINVPADQPTIQGAINVANPYDEIIVANGTYDEALNVNVAGLTITGNLDAPSQVVINCAGLLGYNSSGVYVSSPNVSLRGFTLIGTLVNAQPRYGIKYHSVSGGSISNVRVQNIYRSGFDFIGSSDMHISDIYSGNNGGHGLSITDCNRMTFTNVEIGANGWEGVSVATLGRWTPLGVSSIVFSGDNTFGDFFQLEEGQWQGDPNSGTEVSPTSIDAKISYSTDLLASADVTVLSSDFAYAIHGSQDDLYENRIWLVMTLADAKALLQNPVGHFTGANMYIEDIVDRTKYYVSPGGSIQAAVDAASSGNIVFVESGTYAENLVIDKTIDLRGPNYNISPNSGTRVAEAIITPSEYVQWGNSIEFLTADGSSVNGFTLDGNNPLITEQRADIATGIGAFDGIDNLVVRNNIIQNYSYDGVELYNYPNDAMSTGNVIADNLIQNIYSDDWGMGVLLYNNCYANVTNNVMQGVRVGIQTGNYHRADGGNSHTLSGNTIQASRNGIFHNLAYSAATPFVIANNLFSVFNDASVSSWHGIRASSLAVASTLTGNVINGSGASIPTVGYMVWNNQTGPTITGGSVSNVDTGLNINNYEGYNSNANTTYATLSSIVFNVNEDGTGIYVHDNPLSSHALVQLTIGSNVVVNNGLDGLVIDGANARVVSPTGNISFNSQSGQYIKLIDNAQAIDASAIVCNSLDIPSMTAVQLSALENMITHKMDNAALGFVTVVPGKLFVTPTNLGIQAAIDAATPGDVITVAAGTYPETLIIDKAITLNGADGAVLNGSTLGAGKTGVAIKSGNVTFNNIDVVNFSGNGIIVGYESATPGNLQNVHVTNCLISNIQPGSSHGFGLYAGYESEGFGRGTLTGHLDYSGLLIQGNEITNTANAALVLQSITATTGVLTVNNNNLHHASASGLWIDCARNVSVSNNTLANNSNGVFISSGADGWFVQNGTYGPQTLNITHNQIINNSQNGVVLYAGHTSTIHIEDNNIDGNAVKGVANNLAGALDASPNWWGDVVPSDDVSGNVSYDPWWANAGMTILGSNSYVVNETQNEVFTTLGAAVSAAVDDDVIVLPSGTITEPAGVVIDKDLTIDGGGSNRTRTILKPAFNTTNGGNAPTEAFIYIAPGTTVEMSDLSIDCSGYNISHAIQSRGALNIHDCDISNVRYAKYAGRGIVFFGGDIGNFVNNVTLTNIERIGIHVRGNVMTPNPVVAISNVIYTGKGVGDWLDYGIEFGGGGSGTVTAFNVSNCKGIASHDSSVSAGILATDHFGTGTSATVTNSQFHDNSYGIAVGYADNDATAFTVTGSTFTNNPIHVTVTDLLQPQLTTMMSDNTFQTPYLMNNTIYSSTAEMLYVTAPNTLIKDEEFQTYSVKALYVNDLRGFTVQLKIPKADFDQPVHLGLPTEIDFALGLAYASYADSMMMPILFDNTDPDYYIYTVTGTYLGFADGITGANKELLRFKLTSKLDRDNVAAGGCLIELPLDEIVLKDEMNALIPCLATEDFNVIIDATEPTMVDLVETPSLTLLIDPVKTTANGWASVVDTSLGLTFNDNYNLDALKFIIRLSSEGTPTLANFTGEIAVNVVNNVWANAAWQIPDAILNAGLNNLPTGDYNIWFLAVDDASNSAMWSWNFLIDKTPLDPPVWDALIPCRTTAKQDNRIDLKWANPAGTVKNHIWVKSYASLPGASGYPEYAPPTDNIYTIPAAPNPYSVTPQEGWNQYILIDPPAVGAIYPLVLAERGYYYITIFAQDLSGNISAAPAAPYFRESISYWPGDVTGEADGYAHTVNVADIGVLSPAWGSIDGGALWNNLVDVGPTVDNGRRSRPTPDNVIDIEDLMIFAMNYNNTVYTFYTRDGEDQLQPVRIDMQYAIQGDVLNVDLYLQDNLGFVRGLNIPVAYASGLSFDALEAGYIWPENSLLLHKAKDGIITLSGTVLGENGCIAEDGLIARLIFKIEGPETGIQLRRMVARGIENEEIEIEDNPSDVTTDNDDPVNVVPVNSYLGDNYPNPFNPSTTIRFGINQSGNVRVNIYNARGQLIRSLVNGNIEAGNHSVVWNGLDNFNRPVASGIYFIRMESKNCVSTKKALLMK